MQIGDRVRLFPDGVSVFSIVGDDGDGRFLIESVDDAPGKYPFPMKPEGLVPAD